jgi:transposase
MTIPIPAGARVWLATGHTDMRKGFDGLALLVQETLKRNPHNGHLFVFRGRRGGLIKVLWHDGQGMCLFSKRLERGRFIWPSPADGVVTITQAQLGYLLEGIDWRMPQIVHTGDHGRRTGAPAMRIALEHLLHQQRPAIKPLEAARHTRRCGLL